MSQFSLRTRLVASAVVVALFALAVADVAVYTSLKSYLYQQTDATLELSHIPVEAAAEHGAGHASPGTPTSGNDDAPGTSNFCGVGRESAPGMFIEVLSTTHHAVRGETCPAFTPGQRAYSPALPSTITGFAVTSDNPREPVTYFTVTSTSATGPSFRVRASKLTNGDVLVIAAPVGDISSTLGRLLFLELLITAAALIAGTIVELWLVRVGLRPLRDVVDTADLISGGDLEHRVPNANARTEVGHVATALNVMLERIETSFGELQSSENRLRRFVADASHELKTPVAAVSAYAQLFNQGAADLEADLPRVMEGIERETDRMARLVDDLLVLARYDEPHPFEPEPVELTGLVAEAVETARTVGPAWPVRFSAAAPVEVMGDWSALRQVVDNVLANVRAHTPPGTPARVRVAREGAVAVIDVEDDGPGFGEGRGLELFDRFFRADPSRSRSTGGAGLGLAIVASILRAHGGEVTASSSVGTGAHVRISLLLGRAWRTVWATHRRRADHDLGRGDHARRRRADDRHCLTDRDVGQ
jgi:two-component system OmpR family sensor kinase